jgi:hypothetical protein
MNTRTPIVKLKKEAVYSSIGKSPQAKSGPRFVLLIGITRLGEHLMLSA